MKKITAKVLSFMLAFSMCLGVSLGTGYVTVRANVPIIDIDRPSSSSTEINVNKTMFSFPFYPLVNNEFRIDSINYNNASVRLESSARTINLDYSSGWSLGDYSYALPNSYSLDHDTEYTLYISGFTATIINSITNEVFELSIPEISYSYHTPEKATLIETNFSPGRAASKVSISEPLTITYSENISFGTGNITIYTSSDNAVFQKINVNSNNVEINGRSVIISHDLFLPETSYYVIIDSAAFVSYSDKTILSKQTPKDYWTFKTNNVDLSLPISEFIPKNSSTATSLTNNLEIVFSVPVKLGKGTVSIVDNNNTIFQTISEKDISLSKDKKTASIPHNKFANDTKYYVRIDDKLFIGEQEGYPYSGINNNTVWTFTTEKFGITVNGKTVNVDARNFTSANPVYTLNISNGDNAAVAIIPLSMLSEFGRNTPSYTLRLYTGNASIDINSNSFAAFGTQSILTTNNLIASDVCYRITIGNSKNAAAISKAAYTQFPNSKILGQITDFKIDIVTRNSNSLIRTITNFELPVTRSFAITSSATIAPQYYSSFAYDPTKASSALTFVPHTSRVYGGKVFADIKTTSQLTFAALDNPVTFSDIGGVWVWADPFIQLAAAKGIVRGVGNNLYSPEKDVTRAEFVQMVANSMGISAAAPGTSGYSDVTSDKWYYDAIMRLKSAGYLERFGVNAFYPDQPITREEMTGIIARAIEKSNIAVSMEYINLSQIYTDYNEISAAYLSDVQTIVKLKIMSGMSATIFSPRSNTNRAQAAKVLITALQTMDMIDQ